MVESDKSAKAALSNGGKIEVTKNGDTTRYRLDRDVADALVLR